MCHRRQALAQDADHRDAAAHRGLVVDVDPGVLGGGEDLGAVLGEQRLVGGDHVLAGGDRGQGRVLGEGGAADQLAHDVDVAARDGALDIAGEQRTIDLDQPLGLVDVADRDRADLEGGAEPGGDRGGVVLEQLDHTAADIAQAEQGDSDRSRHRALMFACTSSARQRSASHLRCAAPA
jgi:hypothetical protein